MKIQDFQERNFSVDEQLDNALTIHTMVMLREYKLKKKKKNMKALDSEKFSTAE